MAFFYFLFLNLLKFSVMRKDILTAITQGTRGGKTHTNIQGMCRLSVSKGYNEPANSIEIDAYKGQDRTYEPRETALINIEFADGKEWAGTFKSLYDTLFYNVDSSLKFASTSKRKSIVKHLETAREEILNVIKELDPTEGRTKLNDVETILLNFINNIKFY